MLLLLLLLLLLLFIISPYPVLNLIKPNGISASPFPLNSGMCKVTVFMLTLSVKFIMHFQKRSYCCSAISVNTVLLKSLHKYVVMSSVRSGWLSRWRERGFILFKQILFHRIQMSLSAVRSPCAHSKIHKKCIQTFIHNCMPSQTEELSWFPWLCFRGKLSVMWSKNSVTWLAGECRFCDRVPCFLARRLSWELVLVVWPTKAGWAQPWGVPRLLWHPWYTITWNSWTLLVKVRSTSEHVTWMTTAPAIQKLI